MASRVSAHLNQSTQALAHGRRAILAGAIAAVVAAPALASSPVDDPMYPVWREWRTLFEQQWAASDRATELENELPALVQAPRVLVMVGQHSKREFWASSPEQIREILGHNHPMCQKSPQSIARAEALERQLAQLKADAKAAYERCGYTALCRHADELWTKIGPLGRRIIESPSTTAVSLAAKLDMAYASVEDVTQDLGSTPISYMGHVLQSLWCSLPADMQDALRPAAEHDGLVCHLYEGRAQS
jgi:hypothetical protein